MLAGILMDRHSVNATTSLGISVVSASNNRDVLERNLCRSPMIASGSVPLHIEWQAPSASIAYNRGWDATTSEYVVFAHQDVYFPLGWDVRLRSCIELLQRLDPNWALIGSFGVDARGIGFGPVWSTSIGCIVGRIATKPVVVQSFDELLMIGRRSAAIRFDEKAPNFHFYGLDAVQTAIVANKNSYAMSLPVVHNDKFHGRLESDFTEAYRYMKSKWRQKLPLHTPITTVSQYGMHLYRDRLLNRKSFGFRQSTSGRTDINPQVYATLCGWDDVSPRMAALPDSPTNFTVK